MERITQKRLEARVALLNRELGRPETPWTRINGKMTANIGNIHLSGAYGGVSLHEMATDGGCVHDLNGGHVPKRELDNFISGMLAGIRACRTGEIVTQVPISQMTEQESAEIEESNARSAC